MLNFRSRRHSTGAYADHSRAYRQRRRQDQRNLEPRISAAPFLFSEEIESYGPQITDHVVLCTHADNSPAQETPTFQGDITRAQSAALREAKARNRRITIDDKIVSVKSVDEE